MADPELRGSLETVTLTNDEQAIRGGNYRCAMAFLNQFWPFLPLFREDVKIFS